MLTRGRGDGHRAAPRGRARPSSSRERPPETIIACDCILRRLEVEQVQGLREMSRILAGNNVVGFSTYGEQFNSVHVNQTFTGVAIYPAEAPRRCR